MSESLIIMCALCLSVFYYYVYVIILVVARRVRAHSVLRCFMSVLWICVFPCVPCFSFPFSVFKLPCLIKSLSLLCRSRFNWFQFKFDPLLLSFIVYRPPFIV